MKSHNDISGDKFAVKTRFMMTFSINYTEKCLFILQLSEMTLNYKFGRRSTDPSTDFY